MTRTIESLDALMARIVAEDARKYDVIADTRRMSVILPGPEAEDAGTVVLDLDADGKLSSFELTDHALGQISTDLGIPKKYFDRMREAAPSLFRENVHHWLYNDPKARLVRGLTNGESPMTGRAWMSDKFRRLDNMEIARTLLPEFENLGMPVEFHQAAVTDTRLYIRALFPTIERDVKRVGGYGALGRRDQELGDRGRVTDDLGLRAPARLHKRDGLDAGAERSPRRQARR